MILGIDSLFSGDKGMGFKARQGVGKKQVKQDYANTQEGIQGARDLVAALQASNGVGNQNQTYSGLQQLQQVLQQQAAGQGPNPVQAQLANTTGQNVANQAALMASQRGASANAGMIGRQAAMVGGDIQQQANGQAAVLGAQQQLGAQDALQRNLALQGHIAGQQVGQQMGGLGLMSQSANQLYGIDQNAIAQQNNTNAHIAGINAQGQQKAIGGIANGISGGASFLGIPGKIKGALGLAHGGMVGGAPGGPKSQVIQHIHNMSKGGTVPGSAQVKGDSDRNDKVPALLSPKEIVLPRSVTMAKDAPEQAAKFVAALLGRNSMRTKK